MAQKIKIQRVPLASLVCCLENSLVFRARFEIAVRRPPRRAAGRRGARWRAAFGGGNLGHAAPAAAGFGRPYFEIPSPPPTKNLTVKPRGAFRSGVQEAEFPGSVACRKAGHFYGRLAPRECCNGLCPQDPRTSKVFFGGARGASRADVPAFEERALQSFQRVPMTCPQLLLAGACARALRVAEPLGNQARSPFRCYSRCHAQK